MRPAHRDNYLSNDEVGEALERETERRKLHRYHVAVEDYVISGQGHYDYGEAARYDAEDADHALEQFLDDPRPLLQHDLRRVVVYDRPVQDEDAIGVTFDHCEGCDHLRRDVATVEFKREADGPWHRAHWCVECREAADASTGPGGAWSAETVHAMRTPLVCPKCDGTGPFRYVEDATLRRGALESAGGLMDGRTPVFVVDGYYEVEDEGTENERLRCYTPRSGGAFALECLHEFPIPEWVEIEWR